MVLLLGCSGLMWGLPVVLVAQPAFCLFVAIGSSFEIESDRFFDEALLGFRGIDSGENVGVGVVVQLEADELGVILRPFVLRFVFLLGFYCFSLLAVLE